MLPRKRPKYDSAKRVMDIGMSTIGLIITAPLQVGVAAVVLVCHKRPVLFRQKRPGRHGVEFELLKFRTMLQLDADHRSDEERLSRLGRLLRSTSLDELPSLWNVLVGDMSLIGPRPLLMKYLELYTPDQARRHEVRPGVTGLAQVSGRNNLGWDERLRLDAEYVDNRSLKLDFKIFILTIRAVLGRKGISHEGHPTMPEFTGHGGENDLHE